MLVMMRMMTVSEVFKKISEGDECSISAWIGTVRDLGKVVFIILRDASGSIQTVASEKFCTPDLMEKLHGLHQEDLVKISGTLVKNEKVAGGAEIKIRELEVIARAKYPLPLDPSEKVPANFDTRLDNRVLDLRKSRICEIFLLKSQLLLECHKFFTEEGFIQTNTPKIVSMGAEGGSTLFPIAYYDKEAFLTQSPQLYKQMLMASGITRVYEIAPAWRAEKSHTTRHVSEFMSVDAEMSFIKGEEDVLDVIERLVARLVFATPKPVLERFGQEDAPRIPETGKFDRVTYRDACKMLGIPFGEDLSSEQERELGRIMKEERDADFYFITGYPSKAKPFYAMVVDEDPQVCRAFDLEFRGMELLSGAQREHRPDKLRERMNALDIIPESFKFYLEAFDYGMPPHGGFGLGIERFIEQILGLSNIRETILFPRDCERLEP